MFDIFSTHMMADEYETTLIAGTYSVPACGFASGVPANTSRGYAAAPGRVSHRLRACPWRGCATRTKPRCNPYVAWWSAARSSSIQEPFSFSNFLRSASRGDVQFTVADDLVGSLCELSLLVSALSPKVESRSFASTRHSSLIELMLAKVV